MNEQDKQHDFFPFLVFVVDEEEEEDWFTPCWSQQQQEEEYKWCNDIHQ